LAVTVDSQETSARQRPAATVEVRDGTSVERTDTPRNVRDVVPVGPVNLKHERRRRGLSQRAMAELCGVTHRVWTFAEKGGTPTVTNQGRIAAALGLDAVVQWPDPDEVEAA
jgi:DNA-binding XRE family transcriptional regulator